MDQSSFLDPNDRYGLLGNCGGVEHRDEFAIQPGETGLETEDVETWRPDHHRYAPAA